MSTDNPDCPLVTVGVPVFNGGRYLCHALDALLGQSYANLEVVISDNASDDDTERICRQYALRDPRVRYLRNARNLGPYENFNRLVGLAHGTYFTWASADDTRKPSFIEKCVRVMNAEPEVVLCYSQVEMIDETGATLRLSQDHLHLRTEDPVERLTRFMWSLGKATCVYGLLRLSALRQTDLFRPMQGSDYLVLVQLLLQGQFHQVPETLFCRRTHQQQLGKALAQAPVAQLRLPFPRYLCWTLVGWRTAGVFIRSSLTRTQKGRLVWRLVKCFMARYRGEMFREVIKLMTVWRESPACAG